MSEEKKVEKVEEKKKAPKMEAIEMTAEQKDKFLKFMEEEELKKIAEEDKKAFSGETTRVNLTFRHNINGKAYGPGRLIQVPLELLGLLEVQENHLRNAELRMLTSNKRTFEVLQGGGSIEVGGHRSPKGF